jgi:Ca-activated chloride channel family protein
MPTFVHPLWLALPLALLPVVGWWLTRSREDQRKIDGLVPRRLRELLLPKGPATRSWSRHALRFLLLLFLGLALARPQYGEESVDEVARARDILIAIDTSRSMLATDAAPSRLEAAKLAALDLVRTVPDDRVGILAFAGTAFPMAPLTNDHEAIRETILGMDTESLPVGGTRLAAAIEAALDTLDETGPRQRALIILSDGEDLAGDLDGVAEKAKDKGVLIFGFSIGTTRGAMIPSPKAPGGFIRDSDGQPVVSKATLKHLEALAEASGGYAAELVSAGSLPGQFADGLRRLEKAEAKERKRSRASDRFQWVLLPALLVFALCFIRPRVAPGAAVAMAVLFAGGFRGGSVFAAAEQAPLPSDAVEASIEALRREEWDLARQAATRAMLSSPARQQIPAIGNFAGAVYEKGRARLPAEKEPEWKIEDMETTIVDWEDALEHLDYGRKIPGGGEELGGRHDMVAKALDELRKKLKDRKEEERKREEERNKQQQMRNQQPEDGNPQEGRPSGEGESANQPGEKPQKPEDGNQSGEQRGEQGTQGSSGENERGKQPGGEGKENEDSTPGEGEGSEDEMRRRQQDADPDDLMDASSGEAGGKATARAVPLRVGPDGRILLPSDPVERKRLLENIRRNLENRSEERTVRLPPSNPPQTPKPPLKDW